MRGEIGWRGFELDRLQTGFNALASTLLLSLIWIVWHLPLFFYGGTNQSLIPFLAFILSVIPLGVMMAGDGVPALISNNYILYLQMKYMF